MINTLQDSAVDSMQYAESRRRYFLHAMGVDLYIPKAELANAKATQLPKPIADFGSSKAQSIATSDTDKGGKPTRKSPAQHLGLSAPSKARKTEVKEAAPKAEGKPVQFQLRVWRVAADLLLVDSRDGDIALPTDGLLRNMMAALGYSAAEISKPEILRWPLTSSKRVAPTKPAQAEVEARAMVQAFIDAQQQRHGFNTVLLFGTDAARFALPASDQIANQWTPQALLDDCQAIVLPSLATLLNDPLFKRPTWNAIRLLRRGSPQ